MNSIDEVLVRFDSLYNDSKKETEEKIKTNSDNISNIKNGISLLSNQLNIELKKQEKDQLYKKLLQDLDLIKDYIEESIKIVNTNRHLINSFLGIINLFSNKSTMDKVVKYFHKYNEMKKE